MCFQMTFVICCHKEFEFAIDFKNLEVFEHFDDLGSS